MSHSPLAAAPSAVPHPAVGAPAASPIPTIAPTPTPTPAVPALMDANEIELNGRIVDLTPTLLTLSVDSFTLPNGNSHRLAKTVLKTITLHPDTTVHNKAVLLPDNSIKVGSPVGVIGPDTGSDSNQWLSARDIQLLTPTAVGRPVKKIRRPSH